MAKFALEATVKLFHHAHLAVALLEKYVKPVLVFLVLFLAQLQILALLVKYATRECVELQHVLIFLVQILWTLVNLESVIENMILSVAQLSQKYLEIIALYQGPLLSLIHI